MEGGSIKRRDSGNRPNTPGASGGTTSMKKRAPAPPAPGPAPGQARSPQVVTLPKPTEAKEVKRPCAEHNFLTDVADVRQMEKGLLLLLEDFHHGKLQVFGKGCTFDQMDQVREKQERLSRLHFDLDAQQQIYSIDSDDAKDLAFKNLNKLVENLEDLNMAVHELKSESIPPKSTSKLTPKQRNKEREAEFSSAK